ncbi:hypothetical protein [Chryseobacterium sp. JK1]|uniref:hypothetical protein n=1 Tax=Chryseobacterium sp. JK1 TaxID=874294 RepID=UPI003D69CD8E
MSISIAIVEDEKNYNNALKKVINYQNDMKVVAQFFDGNNALENLPDISPRCSDDGYPASGYARYRDY